MAYRKSRLAGGRTMAGSAGAAGAAAMAGVGDGMTGVGEGAGAAAMAGVGAGSAAGVAADVRAGGGLADGGAAALIAGPYSHLPCFASISRTHAGGDFGGGVLTGRGSALCSRVGGAFFCMAGGGCLVGGAFHGRHQKSMTHTNNNIPVYFILSEGRVNHVREHICCRCCRGRGVRGRCRWCRGRSVRGRGVRCCRRLSCRR